MEEIVVHKKDYEVDFFNEETAVQVTYASGKDEIARLEINALNKVKAREKIIITCYE